MRKRVPQRKNSPKGKRIAVIGLGKSGRAAALFLKRLGHAVCVTDCGRDRSLRKAASRLAARGIAVELGRHTASFLKEIDAVVTSPGVPKTSLPIRLARRRGIPVTSEVELAANHCRGPVIGITGSNGKTTTSHLIHHLFRSAGKKSVLCGNVGFAFIEALPKINRATPVVLELSSFQLEDSPSLRPAIAVVLNVSPNHLNRHGTFARYRRAKEMILKNQRHRDFSVLNYDDPVTRAMAKKTRGRVIFFSKKKLKQGVFFERGRIISRHPCLPRRAVRIPPTRLQGEHNLENALAALSVAFLRRLPVSRLEAALRSFKPLPHRLETVGKWGSVSFVNDSKSTTPASTRAALRAVAGPLVLVAGGLDKGADFSAVDLRRFPQIRAAVLYGQARFKIAKAWKRRDRVRSVRSFSAAVRTAARLCRDGDTVLLSPMCASFDQHASFEARGEAFKRLFRRIRRSAACKR